ncbi:intermembrane transport protein PqiB [Pseudoalteromonas sp. SSDWG2]|uniref:intermembrane transport protein PqiB n=1 Tax=Pseudoalteromonas sp. SSDWG2 TaxID=3139391 RepID=UPI003BA9DEF5
MTNSAYIKAAKKISPIWLIPLLALFVGAWMLLQYQMDKGQTIYIKMANADGIVAGKTEIKVRSVKIGTVTAIRLGNTRDHVLVQAQVEKHYESLLTEDAKIWVVRPRIDETGISGFSTLLSGVYFEFAPGESERTVIRFELLEEPALIGNDVKGTRFKLSSQNAEVMDVGTGVFYKGYKVGQIETAQFDASQQQMHYGIFIDAPYETLITLNTIFWVHSGIEVDLSADGINVKTGSLSKLIKGGVSLGIPEGDAPGPAVSEGHTFSLSESYNAALEQRFYDYEHYLIQFEQSVRGLREGAPVEYRGMRIGTVEQVPAQVMIDGAPAHFSDTSVSVPVLIRIEFGRLYRDTQMAREFWTDNLQGWLDQGLRASLKPGNLLTGAIYVDLDMYPDLGPGLLSNRGEFTVFPSTSSGISALANQLNDVLNKVKDLKLEDSLGQFEQTMASYDALAKDMRTFINDPATRDLSADISKDMADISKSMRQFEQSMEQFEITMASFQNGSQMYHEMQSTMEQVRRLMDELQPFSRELNEQPNMLIFDKETSQDPTPRSKD